ncbi:C40 family peptidase [Dactylosporangium sp. AC04546]|uniref:C40 family peptidase n=1 Tax=Dactylosporangium sp. AC04546 TaxID=2862460 RepID=UPI001EE0FC84|nr:C40 family peptidase [Dactylosporangium sp. AC04546]WVK80855.1 C40 family peptidase [Dactylosporangium sp. AC04546]
MNAVAVPVATMWSTPSADEVVTQVLLGDPVIVDAAGADGWSRVIAPNQPAPSLDPRGYPGWLRTADLSSAPDGAGGSIVDALSTDLRDAPSGAVALAGVPLGTALAPAGSPVGDWLPVRVPGRDGTLWAPAADVRPAPTAPPASATAALEVARRLVGVPYVWGGLSPAGIDCSGLVHLAWRRLGVLLPRDAHEQAEAVEPVPLGEERPGDLYFFARPGRRIHHVGFVVAPGRMLHACGEARRVVEEPPTPSRSETLTAAGRVRLRVDAAAQRA